MLKVYTPDYQAPTVLEFNLEDTSVGTIQRYWLRLISDPLGNGICVPLIVARGARPGPKVGITAAVHGNELNGIPVVQRLFREIDLSTLRGTIIGVPVANIPSFMHKKRRYLDGVDLNHIMPGKPEGNTSEVYAFRLMDRLVKHFDYLLDLHTASQGRVNSYYVRADMNGENERKMALLQNAQIIVHNPPSDGTLRGAAEELGIPAVTLEVGNPNTFQKKLIRSGVVGVHNVLSYLKMIPEPIEEPMEPTVICQHSYWIYTDAGGLLTVPVALCERVQKGQQIATLRNIFGDVIREYFAPEDGIVIGKSVNPVNQSGGRILHLGILK